MGQKFSIRKRLRSFVFAFNGILILLKTQHNTWIHLVATVVVICGGIFFKIKTFEWLFIIIAISMVWIVEGLNSSIEFLADTITHDHHPIIEKAKDVAAGAVLIAAIGAFIIGMIIFVPYITSLFITH